MTRPINVAGLAYYEVKSIGVFEWHPLPNGEGPLEQVHLEIEMEGVPHPLVMRFRSPRAVDELIVALMVHRKGVWG